jgi:hypothetical protein
MSTPSSFCLGGWCLHQLFCYSKISDTAKFIDNRDLSLIVLKPEKSKIKVTAGSVSSEGRSLLPRWPLLKVMKSVSSLAEVQKGKNECEFLL